MTHIVFVDDDPAVLDGLRRGLRASRGSRQMTFLPSGEAALDLLATEPVDILVTDMLMPGLDGADLLCEVRSRSPQTVRIVLSGYADEAMSLRSSTVAHMFLSRPCAMPALTSALDTACGLSSRLSRPELRRLLGGLETLPSAPRSFTAINAALAEPAASAASVAAVIEQDAGSSAKLLQLVNSAFFGLAHRVTTVQGAVTYLGLTPVRGIVLASEVASSLGSLAPDLAVAVEAINEHSLAVAGLARTLVPPPQRLDAFVAGMLHDVGRLALAAAAPELFRQVRDEQVARSEPIDVVERQVLDATHADLGAYLLQLWGLPLALINPVARHHDEDAVDDPDPIVSAVATADRELDTTGHETADRGTAAPPARPAWERQDA
jgi:putative nucleotidyltransferase with HDIG domain